MAKVQTLLSRAKIVQNCYVVGDLREACLRFHRIYGLGPFLVRPHRSLVKTWYRGKETPGLDFSVAFVQSGDLNIELIEQHDNGPSAFRDMFKKGDQGFHHQAVFCANYQAEKQAFVAAGFDIAAEFEVMPGNFHCCVDARPALGHMIELYTDCKPVRDMYALVRKASEEWDGKELFFEPELY